MREGTVQADLARLLSPRSIAIFGGAWADNVVKQLQKAHFAGDIWPLHPSRDDVRGNRCYRSLEELPGIPDACFIGVNRDLTIEVVAKLAAIGAGGAVCFASGFLESEADLAGGAALQEQLLVAAGEMPILGPNCYGLLNYLDNVPLWPDEHGGVVVERGVAIIAQSSNIAISLTMQRRGVPLAFLATAGNQAQTDAATIAETLLQDERISVVGFYLEGFGNIRSLEHLAARARKLGKPLVVLKSGCTAASQHAAMSHTASLAGSQAAGEALLRRLGIVEVEHLDVFLETLKVLHFAGPLKSNSITSVSCSGGEAGLMADASDDLNLRYDEFSTRQKAELAECLGPKVSVANPLDYHTYIWGDVPAMTRCFTAVCSGSAALNVFVYDIPRDDTCDPSAWHCVLECLEEVKKLGTGPIAVLSSITDNMSEGLARQLQDLGCVPLAGMRMGLAAVAAAATAGEYLRSEREPQQLLLVPDSCDKEGANDELLGEYDAKLALAAHGLKVPPSASLDRLEQVSTAASQVSYPCVLKAQGLAHKSEHAAVILNIHSAQELIAHATDMDQRLHTELQGFLVESMVSDVIAELLIGVTRDATGLLVLTIGLGGTLTELIRDTHSLLLPCEESEILEALTSLKLYPLLQGYRGGAVADMNAVVAAILSVCDFAENNTSQVLEVEINPLLVREHDAVAADALLRVASRLPEC